MTFFYSYKFTGFFFYDQPNLSFKQIIEYNIYGFLLNVQMFCQHIEANIIVIQYRPKQY